MRAFYHLLANSFVGGITTMLVWFSLSLWVYTQTESVLANSIMSGIYLIATALTSIWFGSLVDHHKKRTMMIISSSVTLVAFILAFLVYLLVPGQEFTNPASISLWILITLVFTGVVAGNIRGIAIPTVVTILVPEDQRDKANGLVGTANGVVFLLASIISGILLAISGMYWIFVLVIALLVGTVGHLVWMNIPEKGVQHLKPSPENIEQHQGNDLFKTIQVIRSIPGLLGLILFTTFNNFLGGVFMPLMDPYGLSLVSLPVWGAIWGVLSLGFIFGGLAIAKFGLGKNPLRTLFMINFALWTICLFFTIQPWILLLCVGIFLYMALVPFVEAAEHTIIQKIVPRERQGRVFGFAQSIETSASPLTALAIGPITQFVFIPFMTDGGGAKLIGSWFGVGPGRGIALVFTVVGIIGLIVTYFAKQTKAYHLLSARYQQ